MSDSLYSAGCQLQEATSQLTSTTDADCCEQDPGCVSGSDALCRLSSSFTQTELPELAHTDSQVALHPDVSHPAQHPAAATGSQAALGRVAPSSTHEVRQDPDSSAAAAPSPSRDSTTCSPSRGSTPCSPSRGTAACSPSRGTAACSPSSDTTAHSHSSGSTAQSQSSISTACSHSGVNTALTGRAASPKTAETSASSRHAAAAAAAGSVLTGALQPILDQDATSQQTTVTSVTAKAAAESAGTADALVMPQAITAVMEEAPALAADSRQSSSDACSVSSRSTVSAALSPCIASSEAHLAQNVVSPATASAAASCQLAKADASSLNCAWQEDVTSQCAGSEPGCSASWMSGLALARPVLQPRAYNMDARCDDRPAKLDISMVNNGVMIKIELLRSSCSGSVAAQAESVASQMPSTGLSMHSAAGMAACKLHTDIPACEEASALQAVELNAASLEAEHKSASGHATDPADGDSAAAATASQAAYEACTVQVSQAAVGKKSVGDEVSKLALVNGRQMCASSSGTTQLDFAGRTAAEAGAQSIVSIQTEDGQHGVCDHSMHVSLPNAHADQPQHALLELLAACGGHDTLSDLISADLQSYEYEADPWLQSMCDQLRTASGLSCT